MPQLGAWSLELGAWKIIKSTVESGAKNPKIAPVSILSVQRQLKMVLGDN
jgi:hypothetical protein